MENPNPAANQLPEADSLPDGFVDSSSADPSVPENPKPDAEMPGVTGGSVQGDEEAKGESQTQILEKSAVERSNTEKDSTKGISSLESAENNKKIEPSEVKRKNTKRNIISEKEFLEFTLNYQQVLAERDSAIAVRDKLESLCRELQRQNKTLMDECKRVSTEGQNLRLDLSNKFQDAIKEVSYKLDEQKDECLSQLKENEM